jgi:hypothetical protein
MPLFILGLSGKGTVIILTVPGDSSHWVTNIVFSIRYGPPTGTWALIPLVPRMEF